MSHTSVEAGSASDPVTILARLWCLAEGNNPDDTISDAGHTVLDGLMGGLDRKAMAVILQAERDLRAAITSPAAVPESVRRLLEAIEPFADAAAGIPGETHDSAPAARVDRDAKCPGTFRTLTAGQFRQALAAVKHVRTLLADAPPSGRAGEESGEPIDARVVEEALAEFQRRNGFHKPEIEELLTEFGELLLTKVAAPAPASAGAAPEDIVTAVMGAVAMPCAGDRERVTAVLLGAPSRVAAAIKARWDLLTGPADYPPAIPGAWGRAELCAQFAQALLAAPETPTEAPARGIAEGETQALAPWPAGCLKPNSCARNRACMYARSRERCPYHGQDLTEAVARAEKDHA